MAIFSGPVIDFHIHYSPRALIEDKLRLLKSPDDRVTRYVDGVPASTIHHLLHQLDRHLTMMDESGVDLVVLSSAEGMRGSLATCQAVNEAMAEAMRRYPGRVIGMAHTNPLDGEGGLKELDRAIGELGLRGVAIPSTLGGRGLDAPELWPFYAKVQALDTFLFVHPALSEPTLGYQGFDAYDLYRTVGREFDLVLATIRLIAGGVLDAFPNLRILIAHLGGGLSALMGRIKNYQDKAFWGVAEDPRHGKVAARPFEEYLSRLYFDTAGHFGDMTAVEAARLNIPSTQLVLGTDYPQEIREEREVGEFVHQLKTAAWSPAERQGILGGNGLALLGGLS
ncbi:MAG: amidohydrolase family protein [Firmicutes bacterium]|nr:amidohydrolase family protein [Bacillota bacterium]